MDSRVNFEDVNVERKLSVLKPIHATWLVEMYNFLKINVKLFYMHVIFATFAERSLSLLTMRNKVFMQQSVHTDTLTLGAIYSSWHSAQLS